MAEHRLFPDQFAMAVFMSGLLTATTNAVLAGADILIRLARLAWRVCAVRRSPDVP